MGFVAAWCYSMSLPVWHYTTGYGYQILGIYHFQMERRCPVEIIRLHLKSMMSLLLL